MIQILMFVAALAVAGTANAQSWSAPTGIYPMVPTDSAQLPSAINFHIIGPNGAGWIPNTETTWAPLSTRNAPAAWYRPNPYSQPSLRREVVFSYPYNCVVSGAGFKCRDLVRGIDRYITCPTHALIGWAIKWRSQYTTVWPELGLFWMSGSPWWADHDRLIAYHSAYVAAGGQHIQCMYGQPTHQGPGTLMDMYLNRL